MGGLIMTREEQIKKQADIYTDDASNYTEWSDDGGWSDTNDIDLVENLSWTRYQLVLACYELVVSQATSSYAFLSSPE